MKKIISLATGVLLVSIFLFPGNVFSDKEDSKNNDIQLKNLLQKQLKINSYEGLRCQGFLLNGYPMIHISIIEVSKQRNIANIKDIVTVLPNISSGERHKITKAYDVILNNFKPTKIVPGANLPLEDGLVEYHLFGNNGLMKEWFDEKTGFVVKTAFFDSQNQLLNFDIYLDLIIDRPISNLDKLTNDIVIHGNEVEKCEDLARVEEFIFKILQEEKVRKIIGNNLSNG